MWGKTFELSSFKNKYIILPKENKWIYSTALNIFVLPVKTQWKYQESKTKMFIKEIINEELANQRH